MGETYDNDGDYLPAAEVKPAKRAARTGLLGRVTRRAQEAARYLPGAELVERRLKEIETRLLRELKWRIDQATEEESGDMYLLTSVTVSQPPRQNAQRSPAALFQRLIERSMEQTQESARADLYMMLLSELVPDEARILSALSDGVIYPIIHVGIGPPIGPVSRRVLDNITGVGKAAGVALQDAVPSYVEHLRALGLVETGPEDRAQKMKYEMLETETVVRKALERIAKESRQSSRILRRTLHISELGSELWTACQPAAG